MNYNEIIEEIEIRKSADQFVFARHNANHPVLGNLEQVLAVLYDGKYRF